MEPEHLMKLKHKEYKWEKTDIPKIRIVYNDHQLGLNRIKEIKAEIKQLSINFALAKRY